MTDWVGGDPAAEWDGFGDPPIILHMPEPGACGPLPAYDWQPIPPRVGVPGAEREGRCPDGGYCHGSTLAAGSDPCEEGHCLRVLTSGPLPGVFPGDRWPVRLHTAGGPCPGAGMAPDCGRICPMCGAGWTADLETIPPHTGET